MLNLKLCFDNIFNKIKKKGEVRQADFYKSFTNRFTSILDNATMDQTKWKWFLHPVLIFIFSLVAVAVSLFLYIFWYVEISTGLKGVIKRANLDPGQILAPQTWVVILVLSVLVAIILVGIFIIFVYNQKTLQLYRLQRNFISNFTHELKTPVTSLKLYLETFRKYNLSREDQLKYIGYMIHDADRLLNTINRLLNLARIESKMIEQEFVTRDLVAVTEEFVARNRHVFAKSEIQIHNPAQRSFKYRIDLPLFEMLLMNLINNAVKYNDSKVHRWISPSRSEVINCTSFLKTTASAWLLWNAKKFFANSIRPAPRTI